MKKTESFVARYQLPIFFFLLFMGLATLFAAAIAWNSPSTLERKESGRIQNNIA